MFSANPQLPHQGPEACADGTTSGPVELVTFVAVSRHPSQAIGFFQEPERHNKCGPNPCPSL